MTAAEYKAALAELGLSAGDLACKISDVAGATISRATTWKYAAGALPVPPATAALLRTWLAVFRALRDLDDEEADLDTLLDSMIETLPIASLKRPDAST